jgi:16S rRNA processing protein RimM
MTCKRKIITVGKIISAHGIKGLVTIKSFTDPITNIAQLSLMNEANHVVNLQLIRQSNDSHLICKLHIINISDKKDSIDTRTKAEQLRGHLLFCANQDLPLIAEDEFYIENLQNLKVLNQLLNQIGIVSNIFNFGAGDLIEIEFNNGSHEIFPFTKKQFPIITTEYLILNPVDI